MMHLTDNRRAPFATHDVPHKPLPYNDVVLEAAGDHQFDLGHLRRSGVIPLVRLLLKAANLRGVQSWRLRVEKKFACGPETRAITVVGSKAYCVYVKVKPGDNNTGHFCSLVMADGLRGEAVYEALKDAEERANEMWHTGEDAEDDRKALSPEQARRAAAMEAANRLFGPAPATPVEEPRSAPPAVSEPAPAAYLPPAPAAPGEPEDDEGDSPAPSELLGWTKDDEKVQLTLLAMHEVNAEPGERTLETFVSSLAEKLGWQNLRRKQIGAVFATLGRRGYAARRVRNGVACGYDLTPAGLRYIADLLPEAEAAALPAAPERSAVPAVATKPVVAITATIAEDDPAAMASALAGIASQYTGAGQKLRENRARREELVAEVRRLDAEALGRTVNNPEVKSLLKRLIELTGRG